MALQRGNPAVIENIRPVILRPRLSAGLLFSYVIMSYSRLTVKRNQLVVFILFACLDNKTITGTD
jgi:hypothetical protein